MILLIASIILFFPSVQSEWSKKSNVTFPKNEKYYHIKNKKNIIYNWSHTTSKNFCSICANSSSYFRMKNENSRCSSSSIWMCSSEFVWWEESFFSFFWLSIFFFWLSISFFSTSSSDFLSFLVPVFLGKNLHHC